jgi:hypothetical protein
MSREGKTGVTSMEIFFFDVHAFINGSTAEADSRFKRVERVNKVSF